MRRVLKNKPLVEAIFELRWDLQERTSGMKVDPHYKILIGRIYDKLKDEYQFHEQLSTASIPDEIAGYVIQHRFRKDKEKWPLIQIGPGVITVNETEEYVWEDFEKRSIQAVNTLLESYPASENGLKVNYLALRYIDAIDFNFEKDDIFSFLKEHMKITVDLYSNLYNSTMVEKLPLRFDWSFSFRSSKPNGAINLRFFRGKKKESDALIWETMVQSIAGEVPEIPTEINYWLKNAHDLTDNWFFKLIEGELLRRFE